VATNRVRKYNRREEGMIEKLKNFDVERMSVEELVGLSAVGRIVRSEFEANGVEVPDWLDVNCKTIRREIKSRQADALEKSLREKKARLAALMPTEEKRATLKAEIEALEKLVQQ
jgi:hypothetical protein